MLVCSHDDEIASTGMISTVDHMTNITGPFPLNKIPSTWAPYQSGAALQTGPRVLEVSNPLPAVS